MTINSSNGIFGAGTTGPARISPALITVMNASTSFVRLFDAAAASNSDLRIVIGIAGKGTSYQGNSVTIDPNDFITFKDNPRMLVARIAHELGHAVDATKVTGFPGADGITPSPTSNTLLGPDDFNVKRAQDEGFSLYHEFLVAKDLGLKTFSADPGVPGYGTPGLFNRMAASYDAMVAAGLPPATIAEALIRRCPTFS